MSQFGRVDTLVNNAGVFIPKPFTDYTDDDYDAVVGVNLRGFFDVSRSAVAAMLGQQSGGQTSPQPWLSTPTRRCHQRLRPSPKVG